MKEKPFCTDIQRVCAVCTWICYLASAAAMIMLVASVTGAI